MKLLLENWRKYLKEEPVRDIELTPEQNRALKNIYLLIRELIENVSNWLKENNIDVILNPHGNFKIKEGQGALLII